MSLVDLHDQFTQQFADLLTKELADEFNATQIVSNSEPGKSVKKAIHTLGPYTYKSFGKLPFIRLFTLNPGKGDAPLSGKLRFVRAEGSARYEALSYAWESPVTCHQIETDQGHIQITSALYRALSSLRLEHHSRVLWIDALCIDQNENTEKTEQVRQMGNIYSRASRVICWLGEDDKEETGKKSLEFLSGLDYISFAKLRERKVTIDFMLEQNLPNVFDKTWEALLSFWQRPWFQRRWVLQEFINSADAVLRLGTTEINWRKLILGVEKFVEYGLLDWGLMGDMNTDLRGPLDNAMTGALALRTMIQFKTQRKMKDSLLYTARSFMERDQTSQRELEEGTWGKIIPGLKESIALVRANDNQDPEYLEWMHTWLDMTLGSVLELQQTNPEKLPLIQMMSIFNKSLSSDPRDRIYALIGMSHESTEPSLQPDYNISMDEFLVRLGAYVLREDRWGTGLRMLDNAGTTQRVQPVPDLPSWIPDWTQPFVDTNTILSMAASSISFGPRACGDTKPQFTIPVHDPRTLRIIGSSIGRIAKLAQVKLDLMAPSGSSIQSDSNLITSLHAHFREADELVVHPDTPYPFAKSGETRTEVLWRTLIHNLGDRPHVPDDSVGQDYLFARRHFDNLTPENAMQSLVELTQSSNIFIRKWLITSHGYRLGVLDNGIVVSVPYGCCVGDDIHVYHGAHLPFAVKEVNVGGERKFELRGACYAHGIMFGEALSSELWKEEEFCLM